MTTIQVRTEQQTKDKARKVLDELGLDMSTAINMYLVQIAKQGGIPFPIVTENNMTPMAEREVLQAAKDVRKSKKSYKSAAEMHRDILGE